jgi:hypothetical protein
MFCAWMRIVLPPTVDRHFTVLTPPFVTQFWAGSRWHPSKHWNSSSSSLVQINVFVAHCRGTRILSNYPFGAFSQNYEKLILALSRASVCLSVWPQGTTRLPMERIFLKCNISDFPENMSRKIRFLLKSDKTGWCFTWRLMYIIDNVSLNSSKH